MKSQLVCRNETGNKVDSTGNLHQTNRTSTKNRDIRSHRQAFGRTDINHLKHEWEALKIGAKQALSDIDEWNEEVNQKRAKAEEEIS